MATSLNWVIFFGVGFFWERNRQEDVSFFPGNTRGIATDNSYRHALCRLSYVGSGGVVAPAKLLVSEGCIEGCTFLLCVCPRFVSSSPQRKELELCSGDTPTNIRCDVPLIFWTTVACTCAKTKRGACAGLCAPGA